MITVIGVDGSPLTGQAASVLASATLVAGGKRHLAATPVPAGARTVVMGELRPALEALAAHDGNAVVLASGDPGFFGVVRALHERGLPCTVLPAVSSVAQAFARAGLSWDDAMIVSAHGRDLRRAVNICRAYPKVAVLTGPGAGPAEIGAALTGWRRRLMVCEHLGGDRERVTGCSPAAAVMRAWQDPNVVLVLASQPSAAAAGPAIDVHTSEAASTPRRPGTPRHAGTPQPGVTPRTGTGASWVWPCTDATGGGARQAGWALPEDAFDTRDAVITKAEVRALALARLAPGPGTLVWDVGAGSGSVAIECARFGSAVIAVERDRRRCTRIRANARRYGVDIRVVASEAPSALTGLPDPDAVFLGGGGHSVAQAVAARWPARIVIALAAVERVAQAQATLAAAGYVVEGVLVQAARFAPLPGGVHRLASMNPVFLLWAASAGDHGGAVAAAGDDRGGTHGPEGGFR